MPKTIPAQSFAPVISLAVERINRAHPATTEQTETLQFQLNCYFPALYAQIDKIRNHPEVQP